MEWPKRVRTANWENGVLTLDGEKQFEVPELIMALMERLAGYTRVGFHVKGHPATDELLAPFAGHKSMANFGVEDGVLTDACFSVFDPMPKLRYLLLDGNAAICGSGLSALQGCKLDLLTLNREHLAYLIGYLSADLREKPLGRAKMTQADPSSHLYENRKESGADREAAEEAAREMRKTIWHYKIRKSCLPPGWPTGRSSDTPLAGAWATGRIT